jgi:formylglycine-generating enzyme required for sulfatase activity
MSEQQYADFLNCLTTTQRSTLGVAGSSITSVNGVRYASAPNRACNGYALNRFLAYADWAGLRPMSILEYSKAALGPYKLPPASTSTASSSQEYVSVSATYPLGGNFQNSTTPKNVGEGDSNNSQAYNSGTGYYGVKDMGGNVTETVIGFSSSFSKLIHGNGVLATSGVHDVTNWNSLTEGSNVFEIEPNNYNGSSSNIYCWNTRGRGFRYARTAE